MTALSTTEAALLRLLKAARAAEIEHVTVFTADPEAISGAIDALRISGINPNTGEKK